MDRVTGRMKRHTSTVDPEPDPMLRAIRTKIKQDRGVVRRLNHTDAASAAASATRASPSMPRLKCLEKPVDD